MLRPLYPGRKVLSVQCLAPLETETRRNNCPYREGKLFRPAPNLITDCYLYYLSAVRTLEPLD